VGADSVVFTASAVDTNVSRIRIDSPPVNQDLRWPSNGSCVISWVMPVTPGAQTPDNNGYLPKRYMRLYWTPNTRNTVGTRLSTTPVRTKGLKNFRMEAVI